MSCQGLPLSLHCHCEPGNLSHHSHPNYIFLNLKLVFLSEFHRNASDSSWQAPGRFELCIRFITVCTIQTHFLPLRMRVRSRLLDIYTDARKNHQLPSSQKAKYHHVVSLFRDVWALYWKHIWLILVAVCSECGEWWIFPPVHSPRWLTQMEYPPPMCQFHGLSRYLGLMRPQETSIETSFSKQGQLWDPTTRISLIHLGLEKLWRWEGTM